MDKLSNRVVVFMARRKAPNGPLAVIRRRSAGALICQWRRDPASGRVHCAWSLNIEACDFDAKPSLRLAG